jgi:N-methylhydantoinase B
VSDADADVGVDEVDPVTLEVVRNACAAVCEEMNATLVRTAHSPNITERRDCSCALFDVPATAGDGERSPPTSDAAERLTPGRHAEMVSQAENMPVHLGAMPFSVAAALERFPPATLSPGDAVLLNDPYRGGAHLPDLTLVTPVFVDRTDPEAAGDGSEPLADTELVAVVANRAHHADVGGATAGSVAADATEIYQEGVRVPPVKLYDGGERVEAVFETLRANVRTPDERTGDLRAQAAANRTGRRRFRGLVAEHGIETLRTALREVKAYSERRTRSELDALPDGEYAFEDVLDGDGHGNEDLPVRATVTVDGDAVTVDFAGTADQTEGPVNAVRAVTASATYYAVRCVTDPSVPPNHGCYRPVRIETPRRSLVDPEPPAAVVGGNLETSQRVTDVVLGAFARADPERSVAACQGTMNNLTLGGTDADGAAYTFYETQAGGFGGRAAGDGTDAVHVHMSNTLNTPAEVLETAYPLRVREYALRPDSGGAGRFRGGLGLVRAVEAREPAVCSLLADRQRNAPYGLAGGDPGATGETHLLAAGDASADADTAAGEDGDGNENGDDRTERRLPAKTTRRLDAGDVVRLRTPGGGGYGDPGERDPAAVARDLRLGKVTPERVRAVYGLDPEELLVSDD